MSNLTWILLQSSSSQVRPDLQLAQCQHCPRGRRPCSLSSLLDQKPCFVDSSCIHSEALNLYLVASSSGQCSTTSTVSLSVIQYMSRRRCPAVLARNQAAVARNKGGHNCRPPPSTISGLSGVKFDPKTNSIPWNANPTKKAENPSDMPCLFTLLSSAMLSTCDHFSSTCE